MALRIEVVYALPERADVVELRLPDGATVRDAVLASGLPVDDRRLGIFGKAVLPETKLNDGDRVEIYRPLALDPKEARRRRAKKRR